MRHKQRRLLVMDSVAPNFVHVGERACLKFANGVICSIEDRLNIVDARVLRISDVIEDMLENRLVAVQVPHAT